MDCLRSQGARACLLGEREGKLLQSFRLQGERMIASTESMPKPRVAVTVGLCLLVAVLEGFDIQAIGVATPRLAPQFGLIPQQMGWIFSISNIGLVVGSMFGGRLADHVGRK